MWLNSNTIFNNKIIMNNYLGYHLPLNYHIQFSKIDCDWIKKKYCLLFKWYLSYFQKSFTKNLNYYYFLEFYHIIYYLNRFLQSKLDHHSYPLKYFHLLLLIIHHVINYYFLILIHFFIFPYLNLIILLNSINHNKIH